MSVAKPSKLKIGDIELEISPDMTPEQIKAMITSVAALTNNKNNTLQEKEQQIQEKVLPDPLEILNSGTWTEKIALFIRNEFGELEFTVNDLQMQFHALFQKILDKPAITTYLNRLVSKEYLTKNKIPGNRVYRFKATQKLIEEYPEVNLEEIGKRIDVEQILQ